ncbi:MAG: shikimate kinase [Clostridia bacterium]
MKNNILVVCLLRQFNSEVCAKVADLLDMFYVDAEDLIEYDLINCDDIIKTCGNEYFEKQEKKVIKSLSEYENSVISISYELLVSKENYKYFDANSDIVYLQLLPSDLNEHMHKHNDVESSSLIIDLLDFSDRDKQLSSLCDNIVFAKKMNVKNYVKDFVKIFKKRKGEK